MLLHLLSSRFIALLFWLTCTCILLTDFLCIITPVRLISFGGFLVVLVMLEVPQVSHFLWLNLQIQWRECLTRGLLLQSLRPTEFSLFVGSVLIYLLFLMNFILSFMVAK